MPVSGQEKPQKLTQEALPDQMDDLEAALPAYGSVATYYGFTYDDPPQKRIDYVFVSADVKVLRYGALTDSRDRTFFSDHLPVLVSLEF